MGKKRVRNEGRLVMSYVLPVHSGAILLLRSLSTHLSEGNGRAGNKAT